MVWSGIVVVVLVVLGIGGSVMYALVINSATTWRGKFRSAFRPPQDWVSPVYYRQRMPGAEFENRQLKRTCAADWLPK